MLAVFTFAGQVSEQWLATQSPVHHIERYSDYIPSWPVEEVQPCVSILSCLCNAGPLGTTDCQGYPYVRWGGYGYGSYGKYGHSYGSAGVPQYGCTPGPAPGPLNPYIPGGEVSSTCYMQLGFLVHLASVREAVSLLNFKRKVKESKADTISCTTV